MDIQKNAPSFCCEFLGWDSEEEPTEYFFGSDKIISEVGMIKNLFRKSFIK